MTQIMDYAIAYASNNWQVFPLKVKEKTPVVKWADVATTDKNMICGWWENEPNANVGIVTGSKSGIMVLDIDAGHGGEESLQTLIKVYGDLPVTPTAKTGGGGRHIFFRYVPGTKNSAGKLGTGLDFRSEGGYVVGAGSIHPNGNMYQWDVKPSAVEIAQAPEWLVKLLVAEDKPETKIIDGNAAIINGGRNNTLASMAGTMRRKGFDEAAIYQALLIENRTKCIPPMADWEVEQIAKSVTRYTPAVEFEQRDRVKVEWCFVKSLYDFPMHIPDFLNVPANAFTNHSLRDWWDGILHGEDMGELTIKCGILADMENFKDYDPMKVDAYAAAVIRFGYLAKVAKHADTLLMAARKGDDPAIDKTINEINKMPLHTTSRVVPMNDVADELEKKLLERQANPTEVWGIHYAWDIISKKTGGKQKGEVTLFAAEPGIGKSWWNLQDALFTAIGNTPQGIPAVPVFYWSGEMKRDQILMRLYQILGVDGIKAKSGKMSDEEWGILYDAKALIMNSPFYCDDRPLYLHELRPMLAKQKAEYGCEQVILDYESLITAPGKDDIEKSVNVSMEVKHIAQDLDLAITLISSVNKGGMDKGSEYTSKSDVRGSGQKLHDADVVFMMSVFDTSKALDYGVSPKDYERTVSLHVKKGRELVGIEGGAFQYQRVTGSPKFAELRNLKG